MKNLFETVDNQKFFTLNEAKVTDYIDSDRLGEIISTNPILSTLNDCEPIEGMVLKMTGDMGVSYYKVIKNDDYEFEAYLIDQSGRQLGDAFPLEGLELDEEAIFNHSGERCPKCNSGKYVEVDDAEYDDGTQEFHYECMDCGYVSGQEEFNHNDYEESGEDITESFEDNNESYYGQIIVDALNSGKIDQEVFIQNVLDWMTEVDAGNFLRDTGWYNDLVDEDGDEEDIEESEEPVTDKSLVDRGVCPYCTGPITKEEYHIYGMCGTCWDNGVE